MATQPQYVADFLDTVAADNLFQTLRLAPDVWQQETFKIFGKRVRVPRMVAWFGEEGINYRYTGLDHTARGWPDSLAQVRQQVATEFSFNANFALLNYYRNGEDYVGWHRDNETATTRIVSLSLGATRRFRLRREDEGSHELVLQHGSALAFDGAVRHCLPKSSPSIAPSSIRR